MVALATQQAILQCTAVEVFACLGTFTQQLLPLLPFSHLVATQIFQRHAYTFPVVPPFRGLLFLAHIVFPGGRWKKWKTASRRFAIQKATNNAASSAHAFWAEMSLLNNSRLRCGFGAGGNREGENSIKAVPWHKEGGSCKCAQRQKYATLFCSITMIISPKFSFFKPTFKIFIKHIWCNLVRCFPAKERERESYSTISGLNLQVPPSLFNNSVSRPAAAAAAAALFELLIRPFSPLVGVWEKAAVRNKRMCT